MASLPRLWNPDNDMSENLQIPFTVKELLQKIESGVGKLDEKVEKMDDHVRDLELMGTKREQELSKRVETLNHELYKRIETLNTRFTDLERTFASRVAVEELINNQKERDKKTRVATLTAAGSILLVAVEFVAMMFAHWK